MMRIDCVGRKNSQPTGTTVLGPMIGSLRRLIFLDQRFWDSHVVCHAETTYCCRDNSDSIIT